MKPRTLNNQDGIALGPILFIIAILAILAAAIAAGSGSFTANTATEGAKVNASTIIQMAEALQNAVRAVQANGCGNTQISFSNPIITGLDGSDVYANPNAPSDGSCNVFDPRGGGMIFPMITVSSKAQNDNGYFVFEGSAGVAGLGNGATIPALMGFLPIDSLALCQQINTEIGMQGYMGSYGYPIASDSNFGHFTGTYNYYLTIGNNAAANTWKNGLSLGCMQTTSGWAPYGVPYFFYVVLLVQ